MDPGAASKPHRPVKITSVMTRGLVSAKKSRHSAGNVRVSGKIGGRGIIRSIAALIERVSRKGGAPIDGTPPFIAPG